MKLNENTKLVLSLIFLVILYKYASIRPVLVSYDIQCLEDFKNGIMFYSSYWCPQGIFSYLLVLPIYAISKGFFISAVSALTFLYGIATFYLTIKILGKERNLNYLILILTFFFFSYHAEFSITTIINQAAFFFLLSYYTLFYTNWKHKLPLASLFLTISLYTKSTGFAMLPILLIDMYRRDKSINNVARFMFLPTVSLIALTTIFPHYILYTVTGHEAIISFDIEKLIELYLNIESVIRVYILLVLVLSVWLLLKEKIFEMTYVIPTILALSSNVGPSSNAIGFFFQATPFFILSLNKASKRSNSYKYNLYFIIFLILYINIIKINLMVLLTQDVMSLVDNTLNLIPNKGLTAFAPAITPLQSRFYNEQDSFYSYYLDPGWTSKIGPLVFNKSFSLLNYEMLDKAAYERMKANDYDIIGIRSINDPIYNLLKKIEKENEINYTILQIPYIDLDYCLTCEHSLLLFFKNRYLANDFHNQLVNFYTDNGGFNKICGKSKELYNQITGILRASDIINCSQKRTIDIYKVIYFINRTYSTSNNSKFTFLDLLIFLFSLALIKYIEGGRKGLLK